MSNLAGAAAVENQDAVEAAMLARIEAGELFEDAAELSPRYQEILRQTVEIASISEISVLTWACTAFRTAPDIGAKIAVCATILDEVGHAYHQGILAEQFGVDVHARAFHDDIAHIWTWPIMEIPIRSYIEFVVMQSMLDRAGLHWTKDLELHCSYAPYRRTLRKVNFEEGFHMRHGNFWTEFYWNHSGGDPGRGAAGHRLDLPVWRDVVRQAGQSEDAAGAADLSGARLEQRLHARQVAAVHLRVPEPLGRRLPRRIRCRNQALGTHHALSNALRRRRLHLERRAVLPRGVLEALPPGRPHAAGRLRALARRSLGRRAVVVDPNLPSAVEAAVGRVLDPHINVPLTEMGMLSGVQADAEGNVDVALVFPCLGCPAFTMLKENVRRQVQCVEGVGEVRVRVDWEARWDRAMMSDRAKRYAARSGYRI